MNTTINGKQLQDVKARLAVGLPKWPQMLVWGQSVSQAQARDIIYRTDSFFVEFNEYSGGNNHHWNEWARRVLGIQDVLDTAEQVAGAESWQFKCAVQDEVRKACQFVVTDYVHNSWASCSFIFGPHGWVQPDGRIGYVDNVGKWPDAEELFNDWQTLATAFPYLDLTVTLMSGEGGEEDSEPVISFRVVDGLVTILDAPVMPSDEVLASMPVRGTEALMSRFAVGESFEQGLNDAWIREHAPQMQAWIAQATATVKQRMQPTGQEDAPARISLEFVGLRDEEGRVS